MPTFKEVATSYINFRRHSAQDRAAINRLIAILGDKEVTDIRPLHIYDAAHLIYPNASNETKNRYVITTASAIMHFAADNSYCQYMKFKRFQEREPESRRPNSNVEKLLLSHTDGYKRLLITFLFYQGWRITETLGLTWNNIDIPNRRLRLFVPKIRKWKYIPMHIVVRDALQAIGPKADNSKVFKWNHRISVYNWLTPLCDDLGIKFTPHMARHAFASRLHEDARASARDLVACGTWTNEASTARYDHADEAHARATLDQLGCPLDNHEHTL